MSFKGLFFGLFTVFLLIVESHSVLHSFCNDLNQITNAYSFGRLVFITQEFKTIWKFDTKTLRLSREKHTIDSIFGSDLFEAVDSVFWFDLDPCSGKDKSICDIIEKARNVVVVIGEKTKAMDVFESYGYIVYKLKDDNTIEQLSQDFEHEWGLTYEGTFKGKFWPHFKRKGSLIVGSAFDRDKKTLYLLVTETDDNSNPINWIYSRDLNEEMYWSEWTKFASDTINGMFTVKGNVFVVDSNSTIKRYRMKTIGLIDKEPIVFLFLTDFKLNNVLFPLIQSSAKEFFNCMSNSTLPELIAKPESRSNIFNDNSTQDSETEENSTEESSENSSVVYPTNDFTDKTVANNTATTDKLVPESKSSSTKSISSTPMPSKATSGWLIVVVVLIIALILFIILITMYFLFKNKNKAPEEEKASKEPEVGTGPQCNDSQKSVRSSIHSVRSDMQTIN